jgi:hypothetical protein
LLIGRYAFDGVPLEDLAELVVLLLDGRLTLRKKLFPLASLRLAVQVGERTYDAFGARSTGTFENWKLSALGIDETIRWQFVDSVTSRKVLASLSGCRLT